jgi:hypothetical protein
VCLYFVQSPTLEGVEKLVTLVSLATVFERANIGFQIAKYVGSDGVSDASPAVQRTQGKAAISTHSHADFFPILPGHRMRQ